MAQAATIKDFLVALGFKTDNAGLAKMQGALQGVELKAKSLNMALSALAVGAVLAVRQTASELDKLYFSSQRIGASADNINAYGNAISQMGGSAEQAIGTLESLAEKMRNSPGYEGMINSLGVKTKDSNGALRDRVEVMKDLSTTLAKMPSYQANAYANSLGIDQKTLLAMRDDKFIGNMEKYQKIQKELGMDNSLVKSGNDFMTQYRDLSMITKTGFQVIVMQVGKALIPIMKGLNQLILMGVHAFSQMNPKIKEVLVAGGRFALLATIFSSVARAFGLIFRLVAPLKMFIRLLGLLRVAFLATPLGIIAALGAAILALYDDYKTWKDGGKSFIDWSQWSKEIDWVTQKIKDFIDLISNVAGKTIEFVQKLINDPEGTIKDLVKDGAKKLTELAKEAPKVIKDVAHTVAEVAPVVAKKTAEITTGIAHAAVDGVKGAVGGSQFSFGHDVDGYIKEASEKYSLDEKVLRGFVKMEDGWTGKMSPTGAIGTGQFIKSTWDGLAKTKDGKAIGMTTIGDRFRTASDPRYDKRVNTLATALLAKNNADILRKNGLPVTGENLYLLHNIGAGIIPALKGSNNVSQGTLKAISVNTPVKGQTPVEFVRYQQERFNKQYNFANKGADSANIGGVPQIRNIAPPSGNPNKSQVNNSANSSQSNVTIHQSFKTDMTINGAKNPQESANAVKRQQENSLVIARRNAQGIMA
ncbi:phage tail tape measure protein [Acinetobacter rathckeae]|uniref:phage tail tape measure protein n=1 Tax=Acinetobacter rathckeae TaxID=2605272 RepID=UPI0018A3206B|nr:phage tail tape measure protein [Acinetobacter rathckeae]MBF7687083.1 phage tail tape measure protein [Acinetobacter rathckeae]